MALLIVFEGPDGCGKTTQIEEVAKRLDLAGHSVTTTRQPGGTAAGAKIREIIKDPAFFETIPPLARRILFVADSLILNQALSEATVDVILCDRCVGISNAAYGAAEGCNRADVRAAEQIGAELLVPIDMAFIFQVAPEVAWDRTDHEDLADSNFDQFSMVNDAYWVLAEMARRTGTVETIGGVTIQATAVNAERPVEEITAELAESILLMLGD